MSRFKNLNRQLVGERFGRLTVVDGPTYKPPRNGRFWVCKCDCGAEGRVVREDSLISGATVSCGCHSRDSHTKPIEPGTRFGRLVVNGASLEHRKKKCVYYECTCDCGNTVNVSSVALRTGNTVSCGCYAKGQIGIRSMKHGGSIRKPNAEPLYITWCSMRYRCAAKSGRDFEDYASRGIRVCDEWLNDYAAFRDWALSNGYVHGLSIDRIDNDKGYSPDNCRWTTPYVQNRNKRNNIWTTYNGKQLCLKDAAAEAGIPYKVVHSRVRHGWEIEEALSTPVGKYLGSARQHRSD